RRRHTRLQGDWSSDVCSSDLYMQDSLNARLMKMPLTGNARRESFAHITLPRMTNTYMLAGTHDPDEIIASVKKGLYATNFGGGQIGRASCRERGLIGEPTS